MSAILKAENISKQYRLGTVGTGTLGHDMNRWWAKLQGKEDPFLKVGAVNDRSAKAAEDYVWALRDINFAVQPGEVLGIIGKNGAGKSTLLKILSRVTSPTTGSIKTRGRIASLLEVGTGFHGELTGRENIFMNGAILGMTKNEIKRKLDEIINFSGCEMYIDTPVKRYSSGMMVRLGFAVAAHLEPEILVVDEVLAVGDAEFQKKAIGKMQDLSNGQGRTVLFVSHNMASIQNLCTKAVLLENGKNIYDGAVSKVVDYYVLGNRIMTESEVYITNKHRRFKTEGVLILKKIRLLTSSPSIREQLLFQVTFEIKSKLNENICCTGSICSLDNSRIGSFFSNSFQPKFGNNEFELSIPNHNLAPGSYYLNISISSGNVRKDNLKMLDHAYESITFEISRESKNTVHLTQWNSNWGKLFLQSKLILKND
jgi:lipopolysaccharide transport system ATP-binding protein